MEIDEGASALPDLGHTPLLCPIVDERVRFRKRKLKLLVIMSVGFRKH